MHIERHMLSQNIVILWKPVPESSRTLFNKGECVPLTAAGLIKWLSLISMCLMEYRAVVVDILNV